MNTIKNIHKLTGIAPEIIEKLEIGAKMHLKHSNISFKIMRFNETELMLHAEQSKHLSENYASVDRLVALTKELFGKFLPDHVIIVHPHAYVSAIVDIVDSQWLLKKMFETGVRIKDITELTGIDKTNLSAWINGARPMSQPVKAMFYFYFQNETSKGRTVFTENEYSTIALLVRMLENEENGSSKKRLRDQLRDDYEFYISKFTTNNKGFTLKELHNLVETNKIKITK